jgi:hypothetical protein
MFGLPQLALDGAEDAQISIDDLNTPVWVEKWSRVLQYKLTSLHSRHLP